MIGATDAVFHDADPSRIDGVKGLFFAQAGSQEKKI